jgi:hypothetical protein
MPIFGADMKTDTVGSPGEGTVLGMTSGMAGMTDTTATGVLTGMAVHETVTMDTIVALAT